MGRYDYGYGTGGGYRGDGWSSPNPSGLRGTDRRWRAEDRSPRAFRGEPPRAGRDEWWLSGHQRGRYDQAYDRAYQAFDRRHHPRYSPIGGTYHAMGGTYRYRRPPRPLRDNMWFSDWTRWF